MLAFEPGWDASLAGVAAYTDACAPFCQSLLASFSRRSATTVVASTPTRSRSRMRLCGHTHHRVATHLAHARACQGGQGWAFGPFSLAPDLTGRLSAAASRGDLTGESFSPRRRERQVTVERAHPFLRLHAQTLTGRGHPSRAAELLCLCRRVAPRLPALATSLLLRAAQPSTRTCTRSPSRARARPCVGARVCRRWQPQPHRRRPYARRRAGHDLNPPRRCSPSRPSFSSPSKPVGHRGPRRGTCCPGAVEPHRRRDHPEPLLLWGISPSTWRSTLKPKGLSYTHQPTCRDGRKGSERSRAPDHSRPSHMRARTMPRRIDPPRDRLHRATPAALLAVTWGPAGLKPPAWLPHVLLQPACSYLTASFKPFRANQ
jgi:hypothetical protein